MAQILIVDDSDIERRMAEELLRSIPNINTQFSPNGKHAIERLKSEKIDLIISDLKMPEMNGQELLEIVRCDFPSIPFLVMTSRGSEEAAVAALDSGAAGYIPKKHLASTLVSSVNQILTASRRENDYNILLDTMTDQQVTFELENNCDLVSTTVGFLQQCVLKMGVCDDSRCTQIGVALEEALVNAIVHGNLEISSDLRGVDDGAFHKLIRLRQGDCKYNQRRVTLSATVNREEAVFVIRDEGRGFNPNLLPDPTDLENLCKPSGRGILLIRSFMDEVQYNDSGNEITMILKTKKNCELDKASEWTWTNGEIVCK